MPLCGQGQYGISPQGLEQVMDYKTVMVGLALDRPNDACLSPAAGSSRTLLPMSGRAL
jgi:hypothetical protein